MKCLFLLPLVLFVSCGPVSTLTTSSNRRFDQATSRKVIQRLNRERSDRGLGRLVSDIGLTQMANDHAGQLARSVDPTTGKPSQRMAHQGFKERAALARSLGYLVLSEVVMVGYSGDLGEVAGRSVRGWLASANHRPAILHPDRRLIGVATRILTDGRYFTVGLLSNARLDRPIPPAR